MSVCLSVTGSHNLLQPVETAGKLPFGRAHAARAVLELARELGYEANFERELKRELGECARAHVSAAACGEPQPVENRLVTG